MLYGLDMPIVFEAAAGIVGLILILLLVYIIILNRRVKNLDEKYVFFMQDETGKSIESKLREDVAELRGLQGALDMIHNTQKDILSVQNHCFRKIGFVKYNAFDNIGNNLSFAFTVLDGKNDGFCLSSVYGRNESRIFAKPIVDGKCLYGMSEEEKESLENALIYQGDIQAVQKE
ncbi:hypothetical protein AB840_01145 [Megasphaera cerevisiae DSM 20462]|jgi:hypothetical protein|uniref:DUF4446 domain-containing protein n=1 Tax=Megasphaera cerevisiae DSM 20462 TaxID=1122219 RepID=A0A0J6WYN2_9FIRM|nr:DUF4446 family protein [Megasphaera cerevisiae]KMO87759.1 hypothetical protein AB840_01145 [Megasphaera cerevisiae DSM 20462]OKY52574.1 hypothetical protein BSR42_12145 [Megasphaera cerevisiae]SJZ63303.1 Protein of unknown function [Megasphaera cerevisiae DSM 20462]